MENTDLTLLNDLCSEFLSFELPVLHGVSLNAIWVLNNILLQENTGILDFDETCLQAVFEIDDDDKKKIIPALAAFKSFIFPPRQEHDFVIHPGYEESLPSPQPLPQTPELLFDLDVPSKEQGDWDKLITRWNELVAASIDPLVLNVTIKNDIYNLFRKSPNTLVQCPICYQELTRNSDLISHMQNHHYRAKLFYCFSCRREFDCSRSIMFHVKRGVCNGSREAETLDHVRNVKKQMNDIFNTMKEKRQIVKPKRKDPQK